LGRTLGIAGTAKNTGKTTTLQAVVRFLRQQGKRIFLTSIGYDGEDIDNVTGLPKPKVVVEEGDMVATALPLLRSSHARFTRMEPMGIHCALGPVYSGIAVSPGRVVLAGPVSTKDVATVVNGAPSDRTILLDGAFSRLAPMVLADSLILATGAARSPDPRRIAAEMEALSAVFGLPGASPVVGPGERPSGAKGAKPLPSGSKSLPYDAKPLPSDADFLRFPEGLYVEGQDSAVAARVAATLGLDPGRVVSQDAGDGSSPVLRQGAPHGGTAPPVSVQIGGVVNPTVFSSMVQKVREAVRPGSSVEFVLDHAVSMLLSGDMADWVRALDKALGQGFRVSLKRRQDLLGFTVNPFRPEYDPIRNAYTALYVDAAAYLREIRSLTQIPTTDIVYEDTAALESWLEKAGFAGN
jgi:hypothetical protein